MYHIICDNWLSIFQTIRTSWYGPRLPSWEVVSTNVWIVDCRSLPQGWLPWRTMWRLNIWTELFNINVSTAAKCFQLLTPSINIKAQIIQRSSTLEWQIYISFQITILLKVLVYEILSQFLKEMLISKYIFSDFSKLEKYLRQGWEL